MTAVRNWRQYVSIETDYWAVLLSLLFLVVIGGALALIPWASGLAAEPAMSGSSTSEQAAAGGGWAIAEVGFAVLLLGVIALWNRLPGWVRDIIQDNVTIVLWMFIGAMAYIADIFWPIMLAGVGLLTVAKTAVEFDVYWLFNNVVALGVAMLGAVILGVFFPLPFLIVGLIGLTVYDHVFANQNDWMFAIGEGLLRAKLPVIVFAFPRLRVDWDELCEAMVEPEDRTEEFFPHDNGFGIGTADLMLPAAVAVGVVSTIGAPLGGLLPVLGVTIGVIVAAFRLRWEMLNIGSGAGLPAITSGALGGWAVGAVVVMVV